MLKITFITYSGMVIPVADFVTLKAAGSIVKSRCLAAKRRGQTVMKIGKNKWELCSPEDAAMISDHDGFLIVQRR
jgi:hypothetical protein